MNFQIDKNSKSIIRKVNSSIKFITFVLSIFFIFFNTGFFAQLIFGSALMFLYFNAKLPRKILINIFKNISVLFILFIFINWIIYKNPIAFDTSGWKTPGSNAFNHGILGFDETVYVSNLWGGSISPITDNFNITNIQNYFNEHGKIVTKWINKLNQTDLEYVRNKITLVSDTNLKDTLLYMLNNEGAIKGFNVGEISNTPYEYKNLIFNHLGVVVYSTNWYTLSPFSIATALNVSLKIFLIIISATLLTYTTTSIELSNGLETIFSPLKIIKFPVSQCAMILSIAIRFIPSLLFESRRILNSQAARGVDFNNGNILMKIKALVSLIIPLFIISLNKSDDLANAMDARGYDPRRARTRYRVANIKHIDYIFIFGLVLIGATLMFFKIFQVYFAFFGLFEGAIVF